MRQALLTASLCFTALTPGLALAQSQEDETPTPESSVKVAPEAPPTPEKAPATPGANHTVERGDTLWDLSQRYLGSPWYWPKVWSYNPEIANPHWIYPGNVVRFGAGGDEAPAQVQVGQPSLNDIEEPDALPADGEGVTVVGKIGYVPKRSLSLLTTGFVTTNEVQEAGRITGSFAETEMLSMPMTFFGKMNNGRLPKVGDMFVIFKSGGEVIHPVTGEVTGYLTRILGTAKVVRVDSKLATSLFAIQGSYDDISRSDLLAPMTEPLMRQFSARPNEKEVIGAVIVAGLIPANNKFGEHQFVIIDRGSDDGVKTGNTFTVFRQQDSGGPEKVLNPTLVEEDALRMDIGACVAFEVKTKASTCLVVSSIRELQKGDRLDMRVASRRAAR